VSDKQEFPVSQVVERANLMVDAMLSAGIDTRGPLSLLALAAMYIVMAKELSGDNDTGRTQALEIISGVWTDVKGMPAQDFKRKFGN
jgi:hypothetical protein